MAPTLKDLQDIPNTALPTAERGLTLDLNSQVPSRALLLDPWHVVGVTGEPAFVNSWVAGSTGAPSFRRDAMNRVYFKGGAANGTVVTTIFTLPLGYRPIQQWNFPVRAGGGTVGLVNINSDGQVVHELGSNVLISLDSISFFAE